MTYNTRALFGLKDDSKLNATLRVQEPYNGFGSLPFSRVEMEQGVWFDLSFLILCYWFVCIALFKTCVHFFPLFPKLHFLLLSHVKIDNLYSMFGIYQLLFHVSIICWAWSWEIIPYTHSTILACYVNRMSQLNYLNSLQL